MRFVGSSVKRVEDRRILTGRGRYVDDFRLPNMAQAAFVRSPFPHARIVRIDVSAALAAPGVVGALTGADIKRLTHRFKVPFGEGLGVKIPEFYALATDKVRFVGDPVVMVIAESRALAEDACELVEVDYDPLPAVASYEAGAKADAPVIFEDLGSNVVYTHSFVVGDLDAAFARADRVIDVTLRQHRVANVPMECRAALADFDPGTGELLYRATTQGVHALRQQLADVLGHPHERTRVVVDDVGGSFGLKGGIAREDVCVASASRLLGRPVKWTEDRNEHLLASGQARDETIESQVAVTNDGRILGIKATMRMDYGAYPAVPFPAAAFPELVKMLLPGPYRVEAFSFDLEVVATNKCTYVAYRGPWAVETWYRERMLDVVAHELGLDPAELRRASMLEGNPDDRLLTGLSVAGISSRQSLERALELIGYEDIRRSQDEARAQGRWIGVGFATFIEAAPGPPEMRVGGGIFGGEQAKVSLEQDGHLLVMTGQDPHGQSHETTLAQLAADEMGIAFEHVRVVHGDTRVTPFNVLGTGGSRAATWASGAVVFSTRRLRDKVLAIAAAQLEIDPADLEIRDGVISPRGVPSKAIALTQIARQAALAPGTLPPGSDPILATHEVFTGEGITGSGWSGGTHACSVEVDPATGGVRILRYVVVEDCGRLINPAVVEGQIRGGVAQGIGQVLYERAAYDAEANFLAGTFMDYLVPTAAEIPPIEIEHLETDPEGDIGFRGVGEGGAIVAPAALTNAIADALLPFGDKVRMQHLPPATILELAGVIPASDA